MIKLDMIKAFSELDGVCGYIAGNVDCVENSFLAGQPYNPLEDGSLTLKAAIDYHVYNDPERKVVYVHQWDLRGIRFTEVPYSTMEEMQHATIECILKSRGLWTEDQTSNNYTFKE